MDARRPTTKLNDNVAAHSVADVVGTAATRTEPPSSLHPQTPFATHRSADPPSSHQGTQEIECENSATSASTVSIVSRHQRGDDTLGTPPTQELFWQWIFLYYLWLKNRQLRQQMVDPTNASSGAPTPETRAPAAIAPPSQLTPVMFNSNEPNTSRTALPAPPATGSVTTTGVAPPSEVTQLPWRSRRVARNTAGGEFLMEGGSNSNAGLSFIRQKEPKKLNYSGAATSSCITTKVTAFNGGRRNERAEYLGRSDGDKCSSGSRTGSSRSSFNCRSNREMGDRAAGGSNSGNYVIEGQSMSLSQSITSRHRITDGAAMPVRKHPVQLLCEMYGKNGLQIECEFLPGGGGGTTYPAGPGSATAAGGATLPQRQKVTYTVMGEKFSAVSHTRDEAKRLCARKALLTLQPELRHQLEELIPRQEYNFGHRLNARHPVDLVRYFFKNEHVMMETEKKGLSHFTTYTVIYTVRGQKYVATAEKQNEAKRRCAILVLNDFYNNNSHHHHHQHHAYHQTNKAQLSQQRFTSH